MSLKEVCRACLQRSENMSPLLESIVPKLDSLPDSIVDLWRIFTKTLSVDEGMGPDKICMQCLDEIQRMYSFILKCEKSQDVLKKTKTGDMSLKNLKTPSPFSITENIDWDCYNENEDDAENTDRQSEEIIKANVDRSPHALMIRSKNDNLENELDCENDVKKVDVSTTQDIKQEPELDLCVDGDEIESEDISNSATVKCPECHYECTIYDSLEQHIIESHMEEQMCKLCNKEFECSQTEHCSEHLHENDTEEDFTSITIKRHECKVCGKKFIWGSKLKRHLIIHTAERPFKCEICPKTFRQKIHLTDHLRSHTGIKPYKCEMCPKTFGYKANLTLHLRWHTGERPYKCANCPKTFVQQGDLTVHLRNHTGERPFKCKVCPKTFVLKSVFKRHLMCHTGERPFKCENCPHTFIRKNHLKDHLKYHIGVGKERKVMKKNEQTASTRK